MRRRQQVSSTSQVDDCAPSVWRSTDLSDGEAFSWESGLWTGKKPPFASAQVLRNTNFRDLGRLDYSDVASLTVEARHLSRKRLLVGDIILERSGGGPKQPVGRVAYFDRPDGTYSFSNFTSRLRVRDTGRFDPRFVHLFLLHFHTSGGTLALQHATTGIRNLSFADYAQMRIPEPPPVEQQAIASVLSRVQDAIALEDRRIALLKELKAATMAKVFREGLRGEPLKQTAIGEIPRSWATGVVGNHAAVGNGSTPSRKTPRYWQDGVHPWITSTKVHEVFITSADEFVTDDARRECHLPLVPSRSLVIAITGQGKTLGNVAIVQIDTHINQHLAYIQVRDESLSPEFLLFFLQSRYDEFRAVAQGGGATKGALTCAFLRDYVVPVPPRVEQGDIARLLMGLSDGIAIAHRRRGRLEELFSSSLERLMTGQLRVTRLLDQEAADAG